MEAIKRDRLLGLPRKSNAVSAAGGGAIWAGGCGGGGDGRNGTGDSKKSPRRKNRSRCGKHAL